MSHALELMGAQLQININIYPVSRVPANLCTNLYCHKLRCRYRHCRHSVIFMLRASGLVWNLFMIGTWDINLIMLKCLMTETFSVGGDLGFELVKTCIYLEPSCNLQYTPLTLWILWPINTERSYIIATMVVLWMYTCGENLAASYSYYFFTVDPLCLMIYDNSYPRSSPYKYY